MLELEIYYKTLPIEVPSVQWHPISLAKLYFVSNPNDRLCLVRTSHMDLRFGVVTQMKT